MKLLLARHPAPDVASGVCYGRLDVGLLDDAGIAADRITAAIIRERISVVWSSPAQRCLLPARHAATDAGVALRVDPRLRELDFGAWEGLAWNAVPRIALDRWAADPLGFAPPAGETGAALIERVSAAYADIVAAGADCAVMSHGGPLKVLLALARGLPPDLLAAPPAIGSVAVVVIGS